MVSTGCAGGAHGDETAEKEKEGGLKCMRNDSGKKTGMQGWRI
jgi:hypothetical protein